MIKYYHELTGEEFHKLVEKKMTWEQCAKDYPQPDWCGYPDAVCGAMGCWSLMSFNEDGRNWVYGRNYCKNCDLYIKKVQTK